MGAGQSKANESTKHVFSSDTPIQFSQELIDSLQASPETNSTRSKTLELHIQQRVNDELSRLLQQQNSTIESLRQKIQSSESESPSTQEEKGSLLSISPSEILSMESTQEKARKSQSSQKVQKEIEKLQSTLGQRKKLVETPPEVESARQNLISCLRLNDRKPLDCWKEVEVFKREVRKMEDQYVNSVL